MTKINYMQDERFGSTDYHNSSAPTLPLHSPHSPLNLSTQQQQLYHHQSKLSARYIENKVLTSTTATTTTATTNTSSSAASAQKGNVTSTQVNQDMSGTSEKSEAQNLNASPHQFKRDAAHMIRPITTRNAATSPVLDIRKLSQFATLSPRNFSKSPNRMHDDGTMVSTLSFTLSEAKTPVEKSPSLDNAKPQKPLRSTRSLSPRPLVKQSQAIIVSDEKDTISLELTTNPPPPQKLNAALSPLEIRSDKQQQQHRISSSRSSSRERRAKLSCKSEQSSPSCLDVKDMKFSFSKEANRSTDCLTIKQDPWLKIGDSNNENKRSIELLHTKAAMCGSRGSGQYDMLLSAQKTSSFNYLTEDPWIKRVDIKPAKPLKKDFFYQGKSLSVAGTFFDNPSSRSNGNNKTNSVTNRPLLQRSKSPAMLDNIHTPSSLMPMQSAPASPHVLQTPRNPFCSALSLNYQQNNEQQFSTQAQARSCSFSPARNKDYTNPFLKYDSSNLLIGPATAAAISTPNRQQKHKTNVEMCALLAVKDPHLPESGRHSISAASSSLRDKDDELPLNIRRLSDQIYRTSNLVEEHTKIEAFKTRSNSGKSLQTKSNTTKMEVHKGGGADFSDYLNQFRSSEARKAAAAASKAAERAKNKNDSSVVVKSDKSKDNSPLETTC